MTIRTKLALSFLSIVTLVALVGVFFIWSGELRAKYFQNTIVATTISGIAKEMNYFVEQQMRSFNDIMLFKEMEYRENYNNNKVIINNKFLEWKELISEHELSGEEIAILKKLYVEASKSSDNAVALRIRDKRLKALEAADKDYTPKSEALRKYIKKMMEEKAFLAKDSQREAENTARKQMFFSMLVLAVTIIIGLGLSLYIFQSIAKPLNALQKGAQAIGAGNFEYHVDLAQSNNEFGKLAGSFNEMTESIRKMQSQIIQLDRMSAMGQLAGGVAHELNNPLTGVLGQAQILLTKIDSANPTREHVEKIERAALRCRKIVRELLDFSRQKEYNFVETNIHELIDATLLLSESDLGAIQISIVKEYSQEVEPIKISQPHIQQVFLNLINNSLHAMSPGGELRIFTKVHLAGYSIKDRRKNNKDVTIPGKWLEIAFEDSGMGINEKNLQHIFDPFFTTKEVGKGTGLGLTISYGIVQNHKGIIVAESKGEGRGAIFRVRLPYNRNNG
ncbi:MAG: ATP-binding protein [bacterium]